MAKKKSKNEITVSEFKSWISGIEDMQENDWVPNKTQWDKIKAKISMLVEDNEPSTPVNPHHDIEQSYRAFSQIPPAYETQMPVYPQPNYPQSTPMMSDITYTNGDAPDFL